MRMRALSILIGSLLCGNALPSQQVIDLIPGAGWSNGSAELIWRDKVLLYGDSGWLSSDGTIAGTQAILSLANVGPLTPLDDRFLSLRSTGPFSIDLLDVSPDLNSVQVISSHSLVTDGPRDFIELDDQLVFNMAASNLAVWVTDGTGAGTQSIVDNANVLALVAGKVLLVSATGDLMVCDGSLAGTNTIANFQSYGVFDEPLFFAPKDIATLDGEIYFVADDGIAGKQIWATDGSGVRQVSNLTSEPLGLVALKNRIYFSADEAGAGREPWQSDGTMSGTSQMVDLWPGPGSSDPEHFTPLGGNKLAFLADDGSTGPELFIHDPKTQITDLIIDIGSGMTGGFLRGLANSPIHSIGSDWLAFSPEVIVMGSELWLSDGTPTGTFGVDLLPGPGGSSPDSFRTIVLAGSEPAVWFTAQHETLGREPWVLPIASLSMPAVEAIGMGCASPGLDLATTGIIGIPRLGEQIDITLEGDPRGLNFGILAFGPQFEPFAFTNCWPVVRGNFRTELVQIEDGRSSRTFTVPLDPAFVGTRFFFQHGMLQPGGPFFGGFDMSEALAIVVGN